MKTFFFVLVSISISFFTSCSKDSLVEIEAIPAYQAISEETEAHVYIGLYMRLLGKVDMAKCHLNWVRHYGNKKVFEYTLARALKPQTKLVSIN